MRLSFRLAWRAARRERLATFLTALLVALPVVALVAAGLLARSSSISQTVNAERQYGAADASLIINSSMNYQGQGVAAKPGPLPQPPLAELPSGSRLITKVARGDDTLLAGPSGSGGVVSLTELDYTDPLSEGLVVPRTGTAPSKPGEVAVTSYLAHRLHLGLGDTLHLRTVGAERVVATVDDPTYLQSRQLFGVAGAFSAAPAQFISYYVALPAGADANQLRLPDAFTVDPRFPSSSGTTLPSQNTLNSGALVLVLALLEASLTAGTAFAVGARRRRRDLALIAVNGGRPGHTAGVVLANGLVCGLLGVVVGLGLGVGAAKIGYPYLQAHSSQLLPGLNIDPRILMAAAVFGLVSSLISAGLPAFLAAKGSLRNALGKSRGSSGTPGWITVTGIGVFALGIAVVTVAVRGVNGGDGSQTTTALLGVVFVELGGVAICPALLGIAGRVGSRLPALPRLALRDSARQRARSGPAVAAIAAAVSGAMALSVYLASDHLQQVRDYQPPVPHNVVSVAVSPASTDDVTRAQLVPLIGQPAANAAASSYDLAANDGQLLFTDFGNVVVAGPDLLRLLGASPAAQQALDQGAAVVSTAGKLPQPVRLSTNPNGSAASVSTPVATVDAGWPSDQGRPSLVISRATADRLLSTLSPMPAPPPVGTDPATVHETDLRLWAPLPEGLSNSARKALRDNANDAGLGLTIDSGIGDTNALATLALLGVAALFSLVVTTAATVLAAAESASDLAVLGAIGATGFARRLFTAAQGSSTALLGGVLGIAIGLVPGIAVVQASASHPPLAVPWQPFAAFLIGLPLLAALGGLVFSRSRLPSVTRTL